MRLVDPDVVNDHKYWKDWEADPPRPVKDCPILARIRAAYEAGEHLPTLALELGLTKAAVIGRAARAGLRHRYPRARYHARSGKFASQQK